MKGLCVGEGWVRVQLRRKQLWGVASHPEDSSRAHGWSPLHVHVAGQGTSYARMALQCPRAEGWGREWDADRPAAEAPGRATQDSLWPIATPRHDSAHGCVGTCTHGLDAGYAHGSGERAPRVLQVPPLHLQPELQIHPTCYEAR